MRLGQLLVQYCVARLVTLWLVTYIHVTSNIQIIKLPFTAWKFYVPLCWILHMLKFCFRWFINLFVSPVQSSPLQSSYMFLHQFCQSGCKKPQALGNWSGACGDLATIVWITTCVALEIQLCAFQGRYIVGRLGVAVHAQGRHIVGRLGVAVHAISFYWLIWNMALINSGESPLEWSDL